MLITCTTFYVKWGYKSECRFHKHVQHCGLNFVSHLYRIFWNWETRKIRWEFILNWELIILLILWYVLGSPFFITVQFIFELKLLSPLKIGFSFRLGYYLYFLWDLKLNFDRSIRNRNFVNKSVLGILFWFTIWG